MIFKQPCSTYYRAVCSLLNLHPIMKYIFLLGLFFLLACQTDQTPPEQTTATPSIPMPSSTILTVALENLRLRNAPGVDSDVIAELKQGTKLYDLKEASDFTTAIKLRGTQFDEPWLKVKVADGTTGWIYGAPIGFSLENDSEKEQFLLEKRIYAFCGKALGARIKDYQAFYQELQTAEDFALLYRTGIQLRDSLIESIDQKLNQSQTEQLPDLFWLKDVLPGFVPQLVAEGTSYYLFADYKVFGQLAGQTTSSADNDFVELAFLAFPDDSIEYFFPVWTIQTWDYGGHSLLGRGHHKALFIEMDAILSKNDLFRPELIDMKKRLLDDIANADGGYWETKAKINAELDSIINADFTIFTPNDKVILQTRRQQFEDVVINEIRTNQKAGLD